jgi:ATP-binding cassette subfamily C protein
MVINVIISYFGSKPVNKHNEERSIMLGNYTAYIKEVLSAFHIIKTNNLNDKVKNDYYNKSEQVQKKGYVIDRIQSFIFALQNTNFAITFTALLLIIAYMSITGDLTFGAVVLIAQSSEKLIWPISSFTETLPKLMSVKSIIKRMDKSLENISNYEETIDFNGFNSKIELKDVKFAYDDNVVLDGANLEFQKGKKYLIVGPSGGGKSTVLRLLRKYFNPNDGEITIDGIPLRDIKKEQYFNCIANIEQNVFLFEDSIKNNLTLYKDYTDDEINDALKRAGLDEFISSLPLGIETIIYDNGKNISGGERSRIAIARGLLNKSQIIFLDEAFASLDYDRASEIEKSILNLENVTVINVSHVIIKENQDQYDQVYVVNKKKTLRLVNEE